MTTLAMTGSSVLVLGAGKSEDCIGEEGKMESVERSNDWREDGAGGPDAAGGVGEDGAGVG